MSAKCVAGICCVLLLASLAVAAYAQGSPQGTIKHVVIVIQENRTPDNLFYLDSNLVANGADVHPAANLVKCDNNQIALTGINLDVCVDTKHLHQDWTSMYNGGDMRGACRVRTNTDACDPVPSCVAAHTCPYSYLNNPEWDHLHSYTLLQPYFQIAEHYGFANRMHATNQGPSFPAHLFLLSGTSAPVPYTQGDPQVQWFAADNPSFPGHKVENRITGCLGPSGQFVQMIDDGGNEPSVDYCKTHLSPFDPRCSVACYDHPTLAKVLHDNGKTWKYYAQKPADLWTAPTAMRHICEPTPSTHGIVCTGTEWLANLASVLPTINPVEQAPILRDIESCNLPQVSWVIPDGHWSDHAGHDPATPDAHDGGPSWVQHIVNAVGNSWEQSKVNGQNHQCDYWGSNVPLNDSHNQATVVLVVWDDWGGWYDHVAPFSIGYPGGNGNGQYYTYGFRVPLLVVSSFTQQVTPQGGYISGTPGQNPTCPGKYCHDFGSILNFIEYAFGNGASLPQIGDANYPYADHFAPDGPDVCGLQACPYSLSDFFGDFTQPHTFTPITGAKYEEKCFHQPNQAGCFPGFTPADPDNDADETE